MPIRRTLVLIGLALTSSTAVMLSQAAQAPSPSPIAFDTDIRPILEEKCLKC